MNILRIMRLAVTLMVAHLLLATAIIAAAPELRKYHPGLLSFWPDSIKYDAEAQRYFANIDLQNDNKAGALIWLQRAIILEPFSQVSVVLMLQQRRLEGARPDVIKRLENLVFVTGWQNRLGQITAILIAQGRGDYKEIVQRTDALLRRSEGDADVTSLMVALEADTAAHNAIVSSFARGPEWRRSLLRSTRMLSPVEIMARSKVVEKYLLAGHQLLPVELAYLLNPMVKLGELDRAYVLWRLHYRDSKEKWPISDGRYARFAHQAVDRELISVPFEWQTHRSEDFSLNFTNSSRADAVVSIDWNSRSSPVFFKQRIKLSSEKYKISFSYYGDYQLFANGDIRLLIACGETTPPYFLELVETAPINNDSKTNLSVELNSDKVKCPYPEILLKGFGKGNTKNIQIGIGAFVMQKL